MIPSFVPFQTARRAIAASMTAITVTGNNIANANTENYTRQKVDLNSISSSDFTQQYTTGKEYPGQGVDVAGISQYRDTFLDSRYREQASTAARYSTFLGGLSETLSVIDEAMTDGLMTQFADFTRQLQTYSQSPTSSDIAMTVRTSAESVVAMMSAYSSQITKVREQAVNDLSKVVINKDFNTTVENIASLNKAIREQEISGESPNELYDQRNAAIDKLSSIANIRITTSPEKVGENRTISNLSIAVYDTSTGRELPIVDRASYNTLTAIQSSDTNPTISLRMNSSFGSNDGANVTEFFTGGSIKGYLDLINGDGIYADTSTASTNPNDANGTLYYLHTLDTLASNFANTFNKLNDNPPTTTPKDLFTAAGPATIPPTPITAKNIQVSDAWKKDATYITTTKTGTSGAAENLHRMIETMSEDSTFLADLPGNPGSTVFKGSFNEYMAAVVGELSLQVELNENFSDTANTVLATLSDSKEQISGISLDEEGVNLVVFQKAYQAASRYFTVLDEAMDTVINRMGRVGL